MVIWAYEPEDFMRVMVTAARSCVAGTAMPLVGNKVLQNFLLVSELTMRHASSS